MTEPVAPSAKMVPTQITTELLESTRTADSSTDPCEAPGYYDRVPDSHAFFPPKHPTPGPKPSTAKSREKIRKVFTYKVIKGIYSQDPILDDNPTELWRFLVSNLRKPSVGVQIHGTHTETRSRTGSDGKSTSETVTVTDFYFQFDVSKYVVPQWSRIVANQRRASKTDLGAPLPTVRETLEEYTSSRNPFKEFRLDKVVLWDMERATQLVTDLVRPTGYKNSIAVRFPMQDYKVVAVASNRYSRAAHNQVVQVLCVVSCLCVVFWPAWAIARKRMKNRLSCEYGMAVSADEFISRNSERIHASVVQRCQQREEMVAL